MIEVGKRFCFLLREVRTDADKKTGNRNFFRRDLCGSGSGLAMDASYKGKKGIENRCFALFGKRYVC